MTPQIESLWTLAWAKAHPLRMAGILVHLLTRTLFGVFWLAAGVHKIQTGWLSSDILQRIFLARLTELPPDSFAVFYLQNFALPLYQLVAWVVVWGELLAAFGLLLGLATRPAAAISLFILVNLAIGGYYDASLIPFFLLNFVFLAWPSGLWLGFDRSLSKKYPHISLFR